MHTGYNSCTPDTVCSHRIQYVHIGYNACIPDTTHAQRIQYVHVIPVYMLLLSCALIIYQCPIRHQLCAHVHVALADGLKNFQVLRRHRQIKLHVICRVLFRTSPTYITVRSLVHDKNAVGYFKNTRSPRS